MGATRSGKGITPSAEGAESGAADTGGNSPSAPTILSITRRGIRTGEDFANAMSALMSDVVEGSITPEVANAMCNAGGKLLKVVEMQYKYGRNPKEDRPSLTLSGGA